MENPTFCRKITPTQQFWKTTPCGTPALRLDHSRSFFRSASQALVGGNSAQLYNAQSGNLGLSIFKKCLEVWEITVFAPKALRP